MDSTGKSQEESLKIINKYPWEGSLRDWKNMWLGDLGNEVCFRGLIGKLASKNEVLDLAQSWSWSFRWNYRGFRVYWVL